MKIDITLNDMETRTFETTDEARGYLNTVDSVLAGFTQSEPTPEPDFQTSAPSPSVSSAPKRTSRKKLPPGTKGSRNVTEEQAFAVYADLSKEGEVLSSRFRKVLKAKYEGCSDPAAQTWVTKINNKIKASEDLDDRYMIVLDHRRN